MRCQVREGHLEELISSSRWPSRTWRQRGLCKRGSFVLQSAHRLCSSECLKGETVDGSALELRGLTKRFGNVTAVGGIDMKVEKGEVVALLGPNGAGKSTTIDMLLGLTTPDAGEVRVGGGTPREAVDAGEVGAMMQNGALLPDLTVGEVVELIVS